VLERSSTPRSGRGRGCRPRSRETTIWRRPPAAITSPRATPSPDSKDPRHPTTARSVGKRTDEPGVDWMWFSHLCVAVKPSTSSSATGGPKESSREEQPLEEDWGRMSGRIGGGGAAGDCGGGGGDGIGSWRRRWEGREGERRTCEAGESGANGPRGLVP
jgi:hypothetical protein